MTVLRPEPGFTVFDLEFTAWEGAMASHWLRPGEFKEVVQIGAVRLDGGFNIVAEFDCLVRPRINTVLSPYFEKLTGITNDDVAARGIDFAPAYDRFARFAGDAQICAFGHDEWVLEENIRLYGLTGCAPLPDFVDLRAWFADRGVDPRGLHSCDIGSRLGVAFQGRAHNALDDSRSVARGMAAMTASRSAA